MSDSSLIPGYHYVDEFTANEEDYEDEEVSYVTLDLGAVEPTLVPSSSTYRLIGLDTPTPILQLSGTIFKGQHDSLLGTEVLFTDEKDVDRNNRHVIPFATTGERRVCFKEVQLKPKSANNAVASSSSLQIRNEQGKTTNKANANSSDLLHKITGQDAETATRRTRRKGKEKEKQSDEQPIEQDSGTKDSGEEVLGERNYEGTGSNDHTNADQGATGRTALDNTGKEADLHRDEEQIRAGGNTIQANEEHEPAEAEAMEVDEG